MMAYHSLHQPYFLTAKPEPFKDADRNSRPLTGVAQKTGPAALVNHLGLGLGDIVEQRRQFG